MSSTIAQVVISLPVEGPFDYSLRSSLAKTVTVGCRVQVIFNHAPRIGIVVGFKKKSAFARLNPILSCLDQPSLIDKNALRLTKEFSAYYGCAWGEALETWLPAALRRAKPWVWTPPKSSAKTSTFKPKTVLLHDKSPHKRWPVIVEMVRAALTANRRVIFLVPETSLIEPVTRRLKQGVSEPIIVLDRRMSLSEELSHWLQIREGKASVVVGTRSAVFAPVVDLGLIIVYEEEHPAYKQEQTPHYHAPMVASLRARIERCSLLYVNSAPSAETWYDARKNKWSIVTLEAGRLTPVQLIDMTNYNPGKTSILSFPLQNAIRETLARQGKIVLVMNRKGFTTLTRCQQCGFTMQCPRCSTNLVYFYAQKVLACRHCSFNTPLPKICPQCQGAYLRSMGMGTEKLASEVARLYPQASVGHYDTDSVNFPGHADIVITTRVILREEGQLAACLVAMVNFDRELHYPDFRSAHHAFAFLVRLRQLATEKFLIQTRLPDHYCLQAVRTDDFAVFYTNELGLRKELGFPPYQHLVAIGLRGRNEDFTFNQAKELFVQLAAKIPKRIEIVEPHPDINPKLRDRYRFTILLKGRSVKDILMLVKSTFKNFQRKRNTIVTIHVDP